MTFISIAIIAAYQERSLSSLKELLVRGPNANFLPNSRDQSGYVVIEIIPLNHIYDQYIDAPSMEFGRDFPKAEYELSLKKARELMAKHGLDAPVVYSSSNGRYFTSNDRPDQWHDCCQTRAAFFILAMDGNYLYMTEYLGNLRKHSYFVHLRNNPVKK